MIQVGQKVRFDPGEPFKGFGSNDFRNEVTGTVAEVYPGHKWFSVVYGNPKQRISFKFWDVGKSVTVIG